jgi:hypothetical protein
VAYRAKVKYVLKSPSYQRFQAAIWPRAGEAQGLRELIHQDFDIFGGVRFDTIHDPRARLLAEEQTARWRVGSDRIFEARGDISIEPSASLAAIDRRYFIEQTRGTAHRQMVPPLRARLRSTAGHVEIPALIHFDGFLGRNLFHFASDSVNGLIMLRDHGLLDPGVPLLINRQVYDRPWARELMALPLFEGLAIRVQEPGEYLRTRRLVKPMSSFARFPQLAAMVAPLVEKRPHRRIFLDRRPYYARRLANDESLLPLIEKHGFERVFAEDLSYREQAQMFAETSHLVALHGAGLTNIIFGAFPQLRILELNSPEFTNPCFFWLGNLLGCSYYDMVYGTGLDVKWNYAVDAQELEGALDRLVAA